MREEHEGKGGGGRGRMEGQWKGASEWSPCTAPLALRGHCAASTEGASEKERPAPALSPCPACPCLAQGAAERSEDGRGGGMVLRVR